MRVEGWKSRAQRWREAREEEKSRAGGEEASPRASATCSSDAPCGIRGDSSASRREGGAGAAADAGEG